MNKNKKFNDLEKKALKRLKELAKQIQRHNKLYHEKDKPLISDKEFDLLVKENNQIEKKFPKLILQNSPNKIIGVKSSKKFSKFTHKSPMLSLANAFEQKDLKDFINKIKKFLNYNDLNTIHFINEPKIDGLSINLLYQKGILTKAATRGDGYQGEDVTNNVFTIENIPYKLRSSNPPKEIEIRGEIFITKNDFLLLND